MSLIPIGLELFAKKPGGGSETIPQARLNQATVAAWWQVSETVGPNDVFYTFFWVEDHCISKDHASILRLNAKSQYLALYYQWQYLFAKV